MYRVAELFGREVKYRDEMAPVAGRAFSFPFRLSIIKAEKKGGGGRNKIRFVASESFMVSRQIKGGLKLGRSASRNHNPAEKSSTCVLS